MPAYPHRLDDCDCCRQFDADMRASYDDEYAARSARWCQRCAGQLLAQLVAGGRTISVRPPDETAVAASGPQWTVELAEQVLRHAQPTGSTFLRALIDEGGSATAERLRELTGERRLHYMTLTLNNAARKVSGHRKFRDGGRHLVRPRGDPDNPRDHTVRAYDIDSDLVPIFDEALRRLGR